MVKYVSLKLMEVCSCFSERLFKISWLESEQYGKNQYKKRKHKQHSSVFKVLRELSFYLNVIDPLIIPLIFIFLQVFQ